MPGTNQEHEYAMPGPKPKRREPRKRSPKACLSCRARKVRCDVAFVTQACTNCVLDSKQCVVSLRRRHDYRSHVKDTVRTDIETVIKSQSAAKDYGDPATAPTDEYYGTPKLTETRLRQLSSPGRSQVQCDITFAYYPFLSVTNLSSLHPDDVNHLQSQGCFRVPERSCLDELLRGFFRYAHLIMPVINEADFWSVYDPPSTGGTTNRVPVVLLSAMLFVACNYVDNHVIQNMHFENTREAREKFRRITKLLYNHETESSPLILAQVALLLAHWTPQSVSGQDTQWLGRAIHHARDAISEAKLWTSQKKRFVQINVRRLWGCCILSDRIHSLNTRVPLLIPSSVADTECDHGVLSRVDLSHEIGRSRVYDVETKQQFIEVQEQMSDLCTILGRVLTLVYPQSGTSIHRNMPALRGDEHEFLECKKDLKAWYIQLSSLFPVSRKDPASWSRVSPDDGREDGVSHAEPVEMILSMMFLHYDSSMLALCHWEMIRLAAEPPLATSTYRMQEHFSLHDQQEDISRCVLDLETRLSDSLKSQHLSRLPNSMVFCAALPLLLQLLDTDIHLHEGENSLEAVSLSSNLRAIAVQRSQYPDWVQMITDCLSPRFEHEIQHILRAVKAVKESILQEFKDIKEGPSLIDRQEYVLRSGEGSLQTSNWRQLLKARPKLYARLIGTLDTAISWGGPLPENFMPFLFTERHETPGSALHRQSQAENAALPLSPHPSYASSQGNTMEQMTPSLAGGHESVCQVERCRVNAALLRPVDLDWQFDSILSQKTNSPESYLDGVIGGIPSPMSSGPFSGILREDNMDSGRTALDQNDVCDDAKRVVDDFRTTPDFMLGDGKSDDWMGHVFTEDTSLPGDDLAKI